MGKQALGRQEYLSAVILTVLERSQKKFRLTLQRLLNNNCHLKTGVGCVCKTLIARIFGGGVVQVDSEKEIF